jgi:Golgi nucleoside diphosphatase
MEIMDIIKTKQIPSNNILIFENSELITNDFCKELINYINNTSNFIIEEWGNYKNVNCKFIKINNINETEIRKKFDDDIYKIINYIINYLNNEYGILCSGDSGYCLRKIHGPTRLHKDGISVEQIENRYIPIKKIRNMSIIIALNDDYDGGEFYFPVQDFKIKLKKGQIIAFPPYWTHPHMVSGPLNGTYRYTINTWLYE